MKTAARIARVNPSPTLAISAKAKALKAEGVDVIDFGAGQPDFDTPAHIKDAAKAALDAGETKYSAAPGTPALRKAVAAQFTRERGVEVGAENVIVSCGGKHSLYNIFMALLDEGDEVIVPAPYWVSYPEMVKLAEGRPVIVETAESDGFRLRPEALHNAISDRTRAVIINSPSNPTGAAYDAESLKALIDVLRDHPQIVIISDDIYDKLTYEGFSFASVLDPAIGGPDLFERTLVCNGASKTYSMTGWRLGWTVGPAHFIKAMGTIQSQSTSGPTTFAQAGALEALTGSHAFLDEFRTAFTERRRIVVERLRAMPGVSCQAPQGAFYVFPNFNEAIASQPGGRSFESDVAFCAWLLEAHRVAAVPGSAFGAPGFMRLSYALGTESLNTGLDRIEAALKG